LGEALKMMATSAMPTGISCGISITARLSAGISIVCCIVMITAYHKQREERRHWFMDILTKLADNRSGVSY
jgi:hypothetical protein